MKKTLLFALGALLSLNAWSYTDVAASIKWADGTANAVVTSDAADGIKENNRKVGAGLTEGSRNNFAANPGEAMATFNPATSNPGTDASAMIEYSVKMKKGITFTLTSVEYDAIKQGTDNASYHWTYAIDGVEATPVQVLKDDLLRDNNTSGTPALHHTHEITATAGQTVSLRFYVSGFNTGKLFCLSDVQINGTINGEEEVRTFTDFKIEFRDNPYTVILPEGGELPTGVTVEGTSYNGGQHGVQGGTITVPVDGPVKFTIGACQYSQTSIDIKKNGEAFATISNKAACGEQKPNYNQFITWTYNVEEAATLTFEFGSQTYVPYFFAEACDFVPQVEVRYFDTDGKTLIGEPQIVEGGSALAYAYGADSVTVAEGKAFRGWFNASAPTATKVAEGTILTEDLSLYAKATDVEIAEVGKIFNYDLTKNYFYIEDHELISSEGGQFHDATHGWIFGNGNTLSIEVAGNALLSVGVCKYSNTGTTVVKNAQDSIIGQLEVEKEVTPDGSEQTIRYLGEATVLTFYFTSTSYIHSIKVYNVESIPSKNETGYFEVAAGDAAGFLLALTSAEDGDKIFLPNGTYDLGETVLTPISKNNLSIIGQSMEGTIIKNAPDFHNEGISTTATFLITASNTYFQDLTIQNAMDYFGAIKAGLPGGRAVCLQDKGTQTICKDVKLLSNQDTYYSNKVGAVKYFETSEIHGTVDFICGDGSVYFYDTELVCEQRNPNGGGADAVTASNADESDKGYVFEHCTIKYGENIEGEKPIASLGRSWNNKPKTVFLNTFLSDENGELILSKDASAQKDKVARWTLGAMNALPEFFGEYKSVDKNGNVVSPASNNVTFVLGSNEKQMETILTDEQAATYTIDYTLGNWAEVAKRDATQAVCDLENIEDDAVYLVEAMNGYAELMLGSKLKGEVFPEGSGITVRKANGRGGFGLKAGEEPQGVENTKAAEAKKAVKVFRDGQVVIVRDGREFNVLGAELK